MNTQHTTTLEQLLDNSQIIELVNYTIEKIKDTISEDKTYGCDLHNELFNTDYFIIGYAAAEEWLINNTGIFAAIEAIKDYEQYNFGVVHTDFSSSEKVCNMVVYLLGEDILAQSKTLQNKWDDKLSKKDLNKIVLDLEKYIQTL